MPSKRTLINQKPDQPLVTLCIEEPFQTTLPFSHKLCNQTTEATENCWFRNLLWISGRKQLEPRLNLD